jgi:hypothetical protein
MSQRNSDRLRAFLRAKPMVVGVGVEKCGTTSLHDTLQLSPDVSAATPKELEFFEGKNKPRGLEWYLGCYQLDRPVLLDITPTYHWRESALKRMRALLGRYAAVVMLRSPVDRVASAYCHRNYWFFESDFLRTGRLGTYQHSLAELFAQERDRFVFPSYLGVLKRVQGGLGGDRVVVADLAELVARPGAVVARISAVLGCQLRLPEKLEVPQSNSLYLPTFHLGEEILERSPTATGLIAKPKDVYISRNGFPTWIAEAPRYGELKAMEQRWREPMEEALARRIWERFYEAEAKELTVKHGLETEGWARLRPRSQKVVAPLSLEAAEASHDVARWTIRHMVSEGRDAEAVTLMARLLNARPDYVPLLRTAAWMHLELGRYAEARAIIDETRRLAPMSGDVHQLERTIAQSEALFGGAREHAGR